jgi:hypothetical protein
MDLQDDELGLRFRAITSCTLKDISVIKKSVNKKMQTQDKFIIEHFKIYYKKQ